MYGALYLSIPHWKTCVNCPGEGYYGKAHEVLELGQTGVYILALIYSHHCHFFVAVLHIYPFGDHNFRYWDCDQYFAFYEYLQRSLFSKSNLLYSWSKVLGVICLL